MRPAGGNEESFVVGVARVVRDMQVLCKEGV